MPELPPPDSEALDDRTPSALDFPVVGLGASAGGLEVLLQFFEYMPASNGMAFVIILHLSPHHESSVAEILQRVTKMPVSQIEGNTAIQADHVYVIPPNHDLAMRGGELRLNEPSRSQGRVVAIDLFFRSLAQAHQERSIAIVLSGTGSDGAVGLARVKECGGVTLAQTPEDAAYDGMPVAAIATGMVDFVLNAADMPGRLVELWRNARRIRLPQESDASLKVMALENAEAARQAEQALHDIMDLLRRYSKNNFKHYKRATVLRRIERRLQVRGLPDLPAYRDYLRENPEETVPLLQDMLISVTNFFRDREAFEALEQGWLPGLFDNRSPDEPLRVWVAGCATGEEAYSLAMLLREQMELHRFAGELQVFATDIGEKAISLARGGLYPASIAADVSPARLRQFFAPEHEQFRVVKQVRDKVLFALHNVLRDPPFSRLDMICCRNLLIYLDREAQSRVLETFRFALKPGGLLFLGISESVDAAPNLFIGADKKNRIYKTNPHAHALRQLPLPSELVREHALPQRPRPERRELLGSSFAELHRKFLEQVSPPSVLVDARYTVLHLSDNAGKFLRLGGGAPSLSLLNNVPAELRIELRMALFQAAESGETIKTRPVALPRGASQLPAQVQMTVRSFGEPRSESSLLLVLFDEVADTAPLVSLDNATPAHRRLISQLEAEIGQIKTHLQDTLEHSETSTQELKASNEELQAINEELRSASEELETSKEELQSINEELTTVNYELKMKVEETSKINDDLQNFIASTDIATIFIDRAMRIKRYTPQAASIFNLIASDNNRSLLDITHKLDYEALANDVADVFKTLNAVERQVGSSDGKVYLARIRPYRTLDDRIVGAVLTFVDVTALRKAEETVRAGEERLRIAAETTHDYAILTIDEGGLITTWNQGAERIFGHHEIHVLGQPFDLIFTPEDRAAGAPAEELRLARENGRCADERWHLRKDGSTFFCSGVLMHLDGKSRGFAKIARDLTQSKTEQTQREELLAVELKANELKDQFLAVMSHELKHPLNLIQVNTELLVKQPAVRALPEVARAGTVIQQAIVSQTQIIDDLLDLSRTRTGKLTLTLAAVDLKELASSIVTALQDQVQQQNLTLNYQSLNNEVIALCDRVRTEQIFWNLINNAIKFTPAGGHIELQLACDAGFAKFSVADNGQGIAPEVLPTVFGMFTQEGRPSNHTQKINTGLGVGLALVHELTVAQGGRVQAESKGLDQGSTFTVWLPKAHPKPQALPVKAPSTSLQGLKILLVDDMVDLLEPFAALLQQEGASTDMASSGQQALDLLDANTYDLLISDIGMPYMDGYELIRKIRKRPRLEKLKAIALSGYGRQVDTVRALQSGFDAHLSKPSTVALICKTIADLAVKA
ncbi:MAG: chemotaxis protein CheB [Polaromonas sp.]